MRVLDRGWTIALGIGLLTLATGAPVGAAEAPVPEAPAAAHFNVSAGQVVSMGRVVHVRVPGATEAEFFFQRGGPGHRILLGHDDGTHPPLANGPDCERPPCTVRDEFVVTLGSPLVDVPDGLGSLIVVSPIGSGRVVARRLVYWARYPPRAAVLQPGFGASVPSTGVGILAYSANPNVVDIKAFAVRPFGSCPDTRTPPFEQHWLGTDLGLQGHASCAPTSLGAAFQRLQDNGLATVVPDYPDCALVQDCQDPTKMVPSRCFVTDLGTFLGTNTDPTIVGTPTPMTDAIAQFLNAHFGYVEGANYEGNDEYAGHPPTGFPPQRIALEYFEGGAFILGGGNNFEGVPEDEQFGHFVVVDKVAYNTGGTFDLTLMEPHVAQGDQFPHCGTYPTYPMAADGTIQYVLEPNGVTYPFGLQQIVTYRGFNGGTPGCGPVIPLAGKMINLKWWEGVFVPPAPGPFLLYTETRDAAGHRTRAFQYVIAAAP